MHCYQCTLVCSAKLHVMCTGASAMEMKTEADSDDVMECLFAHYRTSAKLQHGMQLAHHLTLLTHPLARHLSLLTHPRISAV